MFRESQGLGPSINADFCFWDLVGPGSQGSRFITYTVFEDEYRIPTKEHYGNGALWESEVYIKDLLNVINQSYVFKVF